MASTNRSQKLMMPANDYFWGLSSPHENKISAFISRCPTARVKVFINAKQAFIFCYWVGGRRDDTSAAWHPLLDIAKFNSNSPLSMSMAIIQV